MCIRDRARALTKTRDGGGFILSWEQGGGKTLGAAGYALGAVRNGARDQVLFLVPQDLIPQYRADISENLGIEVAHITSPAQVRAVARHLAAGGTGWYIVHYEVLSLLGVKNDALPDCEVPILSLIHISKAAGSNTSARPRPSRSWAPSSTQNSRRRCTSPRVWISMF